LSHIQTIEQLGVGRNNGNGAAKAGVVATENAVGQSSADACAAASDDDVTERRAMNGGNGRVDVSNL
jgi:hypothetical protein